MKKSSIFKMELISTSSVAGTICKVCGSDGAQQFYGGQCCPSCRVFFIRTVHRPRPYQCFRGGNCRIVPGSKSNCKACRFDLCKAANMVAESVGRRKKEKGDIDDLPTNLVPYFKGKNSRKAEITIKFNMKEMLNSLSVGYNFVNILKTKSDPIQFAHELLKIEEICDNIHGPMPTNMDSNMDVSLSDVLLNSQTCCERTSVSWNITTTTDTMTELLHLAYCRCATLVADFISAAPEIHLIEDRDRLRLVHENYCDVGLLTMLFNTWTQNVRDGLLFPHGFKFCPTEGATDEMTDFLRKLVNFLQDRIVPIFDKIQLTPHEYVILKLVALFTPSTVLSDKSQEIVNMARNRYTKILVDYVNAVFYCWPEDWRVQRICDLFHIIGLLRVAAAFDNDFCVKMVALNIGNMQGNLPFDIHVRSY